MDFSENLKAAQRVIEEELEKYMRFENLPQKRVFDAMAYSLLAGGKRLRPVIMIYACEMCGGRLSDVLPFACAIEMIHTYSLIHDDLPAMDNDSLRRGKPTNHIQFDEATAILAGDALLNMAFEITAGNKNPALSDRIILKAVNELAKASGAFGMIGGQMIDIENENKHLSEAELKNLHALKTGALIRTSGVCGAIIADADENEIRAVDEYCLNLGIAFQIRDDILDVTGDAGTLGKPIGSDKENHKNTYLSFMSPDDAEKLVYEYTKKATDAISCFGNAASELVWLAESLIERCK